MTRPIALALRTAVALAALACSLTHAQLVDAGEPAPDFAGTWYNHADTSLADLGGRVIYLEFWGSRLDEDWERDRVSDLTRLHRKKADAGLMVIAVTTADKEELEKNLKAWWIDFPVVWLEEEAGEKIESRYGGRAALVDSHGVLNWRGSVWGVDEDRVDELLVDASIISQLPGEYEKINAHLRFSSLDVGKAHKEIAKALRRDKENEHLLLGKERLERVFANDIARVDAMIEERDYGGANALLEKLAETWSTSEPGKKAKERASELKRDKEAKRDIKAYEIFLEADHYRRIRKYEKARALYTKVMDNYEGTLSAERSRRFFSQIRNR